LLAVMSTNTHPTRQLRLIDIENLAGASTVNSDTAARVAGAVASIIPTGDADLTIVAACHRNGVAAGLAHPGARLVCKSGTDGADIALTDAFAEQPLLESFTGVVIASGDRFFVETAEAAHVLGLRVTVVSRPECLSRRLAAIADEVALLDVAA
jgi:hypothetical protein